MEFSKFVSLLSSGQLYFCRSDLFEDQFEGSYSKANIELRPTIYKDIPADALQVFSEHMRWSRLWTYINCWHLNEHESSAMWNLYQPLNQTVAIETDYDTLVNVLPNNVYVGLVDYINYETDWMPEGNNFHPFVHKKIIFKHENEFRAIIQEFPYTIDGKIDKGPKDPPCGLSISVDLNKLIKRIYVSPKMDNWLIQLTKLIIQKFNYSFDVNRSELFGKPVF